MGRQMGPKRGFAGHTAEEEAAHHHMEVEKWKKITAVSQPGGTERHRPSAREGAPGRAWQQAQMGGGGAGERMEHRQRHAARNG